MYNDADSSMPPMGVPPSGPRPVADFNGASAPPPGGPPGEDDLRNGSSGGAGGYDSRPVHRPRHAPQNPQESNVLGVFGISIRTKEHDLEDEFGRYGRVQKVVIVYDQRTERSRGFGFVTMDTVEDARACIEKLNGIDLHGRRIRVDFSVTKRPHEPTPGQYMGERRPDDDQYRGGRSGSYRDDRRDDRYARRDDRDRYDRRDRDYDRDYRRRSRSRSRSPYRSSRRHSRSRSRSPRRERAPLPERDDRA